MKNDGIEGDLLPAARDPRLPVLEYGTVGPPRASRPPRPPVLGLLAIGVLLLPMTVALGYPVACLLPYGWESTAIVEVPTSVPGKYGPTANFTIVANGTGRRSRARMEWGYVNFASARLFGSIDVDFRTMAYRYGGPAYRPLTRDALLQDFMSAAGFEPASAEASAVADALLVEFRNLGEGRLPPDMTGQPYRTQVPSLRHSMSGHYLLGISEFGCLLWWPWYGPYCLPVWAASWWFAARPLIRRYRRRLAEYRWEVE